jgi:hypothetical protein
MQYTEQQPSPTLAPHLECLWFVSETDTSAAKGAFERVLPDGCVEWIFHLGSPFQRWTTPGKWECQPRSFVVGLLTRFILLQAEEVCACRNGQRQRSGLKREHLQPGRYRPPF